MITELTSHLTRMTRCKVCGMTFPSTDQIVAAPTEDNYVETCPADHVADYVHADYYFA
jgi:hypothetical protein